MSFKTLHVQLLDKEALTTRNRIAVAQDVRRH